MNNHNTSAIIGSILIIIVLVITAIFVVPTFISSSPDNKNMWNGISQDKNNTAQMATAEGRLSFIAQNISDRQTNIGVIVTARETLLSALTVRLVIPYSPNQVTVSTFELSPEMQTAGWRLMISKVQTDPAQINQSLDISFINMSVDGLLIDPSLPIGTFSLTAEPGTIQPEQLTVDKNVTKVLHKNGTELNLVVDPLAY